MKKEPIKIIVVDDEFVIVMSLCYYFEDHGFIVKGVQDGQKALEMVQNEHFDLAIVDVRMPKYEGSDIILKMHEIDPGTRFILHTGSGSYKLRQSLQDIGMTDRCLFRKPVSDLSRFLDVINEIFSEK